MPERIKIVAISGPTAVGKTAEAVRIAQRIGAEIVGADSMQVYRGADIGTAKPTAEELAGVPHHLLDVVQPGEIFNAADFAALANKVIRDIASRGRVALVVGGSGLYLRALLYGLVEAPPADPDVRRGIAEEAEAKGWEHLHRRLAEADPDAAFRIDPNDAVRITRGLEVLRITGVPLGQIQRRHAFSKPRFDALKIAFVLDRGLLRERIGHRVDAMMARGFLEETRRLFEGGAPAAKPPLNGVGYRRLVQHLTGVLAIEDAVSKIKTDTSRLAKRQMTWINGEGDWKRSPPDADVVWGDVARFLDVPRSKA